jgi:hypothetical protein
VAQARHIQLAALLFTMQAAVAAEYTVQLEVPQD